MFLINDILVSDQLFEEHFECDLNKCKGACCWEGDFGAPVTHGEIREIEKIIDIVLPLLPDENRKKIENEAFTIYYKEPDFVGTNLIEDGSCVFLKKNNEGIALCILESLFREGTTDWKKPVSCELFPVRVNKSEIKGFEALNYYEWDICKDACTLGSELQVRIFQFLKEPLIRKYGPEFYQTLTEAAQEWEREFNS